MRVQDCVLVLHEQAMQLYEHPEIERELQAPLYEKQEQMNVHEIDAR